MNTKGHASVNIAFQKDVYIQSKYNEIFLFDYLLQNYDKWC